MNETKEGRIVLRHNGKDEISVRIECTEKQAAKMTYHLLKTIREKSRKVYEDIMANTIWEDLDEDEKAMFDILFGGK